MNVSRRSLAALGATLLFGAALAGCSSSPSRSTDLTQVRDYSRYVLVTVRNARPPAPLRAGSSVRTYGGESPYPVAPAARRTASQIAAAYGLRESDAWPIEMLGVHCVVFEIPAGAQVDATLARLRRDQRVESAQPLQTFSTLGAGSDAGYRKLQRNLDMMRIDAAHRWSRGAGVRIGVIDTGVDATHPDLAGRIVRQEDLVGGRRDAATSDRHGTAIAGVIAATGANDSGVIGVAPEAQLYALRACWSRADDATRAACSSFTLAKALVAAIEARLHVVNLSLAGPADPLLTRIVETGLKRGVVFVGATPVSDAARSFPTNIDGVIAASAAGARADADTTVFTSVLAPASDVLTLTPGGRYDFMSGSSLAAASVSGGVALLLARDRALNASEVRTALARSMRTSEGGAGSVDLCAALATVVPEATCEP